MAKSKSQVLKNCIALLLITLVAGLALSAVNEITKAPIAKAEQQAIGSFFSRLDSLITLHQRKRLWFAK